MISERDSVYHLRTNFKKVLPKSSPNYLQKKSINVGHSRGLMLLLWYVLQHLNALKCRWSLTWHQYSSAMKKVNFYACPRLTFLKKKCHGKRLEEHFWASRFQVVARASAIHVAPASLIPLLDKFKLVGVFLTLIASSIHVVPAWLISLKYKSKLFSVLLTLIASAITTIVFKDGRRCKCIIWKSISVY